MRSDPAAPARWGELDAPAHWRAIDFISDLHLQENEAATFAAWQRYMADTMADALFILGDLFEVWVGDDITATPGNTDSDFVLQCQRVIQTTAARLPVFFIHGNRDFLLGDNFARACGMTLLSDPTVLDFDGQRCLLSHGDALCLGDVDYQKFRLQVRSPEWQTSFLARPLAERQAIARDLRARSQSLKSSGASYADVDTEAAQSLLRRHGATTLIHGHTHRPQDHVLDGSVEPALRRLVLSDWEADALPPRLQVLRLQAGQTPARVALTDRP